jgi:hypothetical protein
VFEADTAYLTFVGRDSFYGWLASQRGELFRDEAFAGLSVLTTGRPRVPPSVLAVALVLGVALDARPFAKSPLQELRAQLILHAERAAIFRASLELATRRGRFRTQSGERRKLAVALDTTNILGRGAVKDTYHLLGDGIIHLARELATLAGQSLAAWAEAQGYGRYVGPSKPARPAARSGPDGRWSSIGSRGWYSSASARPATSGGPRRSSSC